jgi:phosphatidylcholine synthase
MGRRIAAAAVHAFTATGVVCALMATLAVAEGAYGRCFAWLGLALLIDGIDGTFARLVGVKYAMPRVSGDKLDLVVDYTTYVFVPVLALLHAKIFAGALGLLLAGAVLMSSLYHFVDEGNKSTDNCFVGFPAIWNVVAFYFFAVPLPGWLVTSVVAACVALTFVPMRCVHPMRVERLFVTNVAVSGLWLLAAAYVVWKGFPADLPSTVVLLAVAAYMLWLTLTWPLSRWRPDAQSLRE